MSNGEEFEDDEIEQLLGLALLEIVRDHREQYRTPFMTATLLLREEVAKFSGHAEPREIPYNWPDLPLDIFVDSRPDLPHLADVWANNMVVQSVRDTAHTVSAIISVRPELALQHRYEWKEALAHEWLEVMLAYFYPEEWRRFKRVRGRVKLAAEYADQRKRTYWQDSPSFGRFMHEALKRLLVSKKSIETLADLVETEALRKELEPAEKNKGLLTVRAMCTKAPRGYEKLVGIFSSKFSVAPELVQERFDEVLY